MIQPIIETTAYRLGVIVRQWSPGDGRSRYRFFPKPAFDYSVAYNSADGIYTALGAAGARAYLAGFRDGATYGLPLGTRPRSER